MNRFVQAGILWCVLRGIFLKSKFCSALNEFVDVNLDAVAKTLARTSHWTITPYGNAALYLSGLSNQKLSIWPYMSNGSYRTYEWNSIRKHCMFTRKYLCLDKR